VIDLFAGAGGWDVAGRLLGIDFLGIEVDPIACATRRSAGLKTLQADVRLLDIGDYSPCEILVASPPCQRFSSSSPRRKIVSTLPYNIKRRTKWRGYSDQGEELVAVPIEWVGMLRPYAVAFEQVPAVLPIWEEHAARMGEWGYSTWTGVLNAADFGVPQDRPRAVLLASRVDEVAPPARTERSATIYPTIVCNRRSAGGVIVGRSLKAGGVAVPFAQAGELQTFPLDYPWQGGVEAKSRQIGNAIPPLFAAAIIKALLP
jgi:DNA (cytosine-5)-methyltransferase 1